MHAYKSWLSFKSQKYSPKLNFDKRFYVLKKSLLELTWSNLNNPGNIDGFVATTATWWRSRMRQTILETKFD